MTEYASAIVKPDDGTSTGTHNEPFVDLNTLVVAPATIQGQVVELKDAVTHSFADKVDHANVAFNRDERTIVYTFGSRTVEYTLPPDTTLTPRTWGFMTEYLRNQKVPLTKSAQLEEAVKYGELHAAIHKVNPTPGEAGRLLMDALVRGFRACSFYGSDWNAPTVEIHLRQEGPEARKSALFKEFGARVRLQELGDKLDRLGIDMATHLGDDATEWVMQQKTLAGEREAAEAKRLEADGQMVLGSVFDPTGDDGKAVFDRVVYKLRRDEELEEIGAKNRAKDAEMPVTISISFSRCSRDAGFEDRVVTIQLAKSDPPRYGLRIFVNGDHLKERGAPFDPAKSLDFPDKELHSVAELSKWLVEYSAKTDPVTNSKRDTRWKALEDLSYCSFKLLS